MPSQWDTLTLHACHAGLATEQKYVSDNAFLFTNGPVVIKRLADWFVSVISQHALPWLF